MVMGKVKGRSLGDDGKVVGSYDDNSILNSIIYDIEFPDRQVKQYSANILAENMLLQVNDNGHNWLMMDAIIDFKKDTNSSPNGGQISFHNDRPMQTEEDTWLVVLGQMEG